MCNTACLDFGRAALSPEEVAGRDVLEVGALNYNGSLRALLQAWTPRQYTGVDLMPGPGVDVVCPAENLTDHFGLGMFDVVVSTEMLEHVWDWRRVISNLKQILRPSGRLLITTRSRGYGYHASPHDYWRYELDDLRVLFADFTIQALQKDPLMPGVFLKAIKPVAFKECNLEDHALYSMLARRRCCKVHRWQRAAGFLYWQTRLQCSRLLPERLKQALRKARRTRPPVNLETPP